MGFLRRLFGGGEETPRRDTVTRQSVRPPLTEDERAVERYRYMLRTAPPETIEQAHAEAFAKLTPEQRQLALQELSANVPERERMGASSDPQALARMATRAEMRQPGTLERAFGGNRVGMGMGGMIAGTLLASVAGSFIGTAIADQFFADDIGFDGRADAGAGADADTGTDAPVDDPDLDTMAADDSGFDSGFDDTGGDFGGFEG